MKKNGTVKMLVLSAVSVVLCLVMLLGATFAWFSSEVTSKNNIISIGDFDLDIEWKDDGTNTQWADLTTTEVFLSTDKALMPGEHTKIVYVKVTNNNECDVDAILTICAPEGNQALEYHYTVLDMPVVQEGETPTEPTATYSQLTTTGTFDAEVNVLTTANGLIGAGEYKIVAIAFELPGGYEMPEPEEGTTVSLTTTFDILVRGTQHATTTTTSEPDPNP